MHDNLIEPMEFFKIDKISDDVYNIAPNVVLRFSVSLSKVSNGKRYHFHKEFEYPSPNIPEQPTLVTIKRNFDYYLSIENIQRDPSLSNKLFIRIGPQEYILFKRGLEEAISWYNNEKYNKLYAKDRGNLVLMPPIPEYTISNLPMGKYITMTPAIINKGFANADKEVGIRIFFSDPSYYFDLTLDRFMGLYYSVCDFNMYQCALMLINYIQRPEFGTNRFVLEPQKNGYHDSTPKSGVSGIEGRYVTPQDIKNNIDILEG